MTSNKIVTNEELDKVLQTDALLLLEIYTEFFGPCSVMACTLQNMKSMISGDRMRILTVECDRIDVFKRFVNKSESVWLFVHKSRIVNCVLGVNAHKLTSIAQLELKDLEHQCPERPVFALDELTLEEKMRQQAAQVTTEQSHIVRQQLQRQKHETHMRTVYNKISNRMGDMAITIILPHVMNKPDLMRRISEAADQLKLTEKANINVRIQPEHLDVINFDSMDDSENVPAPLWDHIVNKDVLMVCWQISDDASKSVEFRCKQLVQLFMQQPPEIPKSKKTNVKQQPPLVLSPITYQILEKYKHDVDDDSLLRLVVRVEIDQIVGIQAESKPSPELTMIEQQIDRVIADVFVGGNETYLDRTFIKDEVTDLMTKMHNREFKIHNFESPQYLEVDPHPSIPTMVGKLDAIWTPTNKRTNAFLMYLYFKSFLPPEDCSGRPHILMIFELSRLKAILPVMGEYKNDVLAFGYFSGTDDLEAVELLAKSNASFECMWPHQPVDSKIAIKLACDSGDALLSLGSLEPCYISQNEKEGLLECETYFPLGYPCGIRVDDIQFARESLILRASSFEYN